MKTIKISSSQVFFIFLGLFGLWSCSEIPPFISYQPDIVLAKDTCYTVTQIPEKQDKNVLIEDVSGVRCVNCPEAAEAAHTVDKANPGRIVVVTLHPTSNANLTTPLGNDTFNTDASENIFQKLIGGAQGLPAGAIDRKKFSGESRVAVAPAKWGTYAAQQMLLKANVNLELDANLDKETRTVNLEVKTSFTEDDQTPTYMTILILESKIIQPQATRTGVDDNYEHNDIMRFAYTNFSGLKLKDSPKRGDVCEKGFSIAIPESINLENATIAVLLNKIDDDNHEVLQCAEVQLSK